jgi:hypothetical protein
MAGSLDAIFEAVDQCKKSIGSSRATKRRVCAELHFTAEDVFCAALIHHQQDEIRGLSAQLKPEAAPFERHHGWSAPPSVKVFALATRHHASAITPTNS